MALNIRLLKESFEAVKPVANDVVERFYKTLFEKHPESRRLFKTDRMDQQKKALIQSLVTIFELIERPADLESYLSKLGVRHLKYGVEAQHYKWVGDCLLDTLAFFFAETWTAELADSWSSALSLIAETMQQACKNQMASASSGEDLGREVESVLRSLMKNTVYEVCSHKDIRELAALHAKNLIKEALQEQLVDLREKFKNRKVA